MNIKNKKDFGLGIFSILLAGVITWLSLQLKQTGYEGDPGPKMFPLIGAAVMAICGIALIVKPDAPTGAFLSPKQWLAAGKIFLIYILMVALLYFFGFMVAVPVVMFILTYVLSSLSMTDATKKKRLITSLIYGVAGGGLVYAAYVLGLRANLPKGLIWTLLK